MENTLSDCIESFLLKYCVDFSFSFIYLFIYLFIFFILFFFCVRLEPLALVDIFMCFFFSECISIFFIGISILQSIRTIKKVQKTFGGSNADGSFTTAVSYPLLRS